MKKIKHNEYSYELIFDESDRLEDIYQYIRLIIAVENCFKHKREKVYKIKIQLPTCYKKQATLYYVNHSDSDDPLSLFL